MTATLEGGEWSAARPGRTLPPGKSRYPFYKRLGGPQGRSGRAENLVPTGIRSRTVQSVVSRYTDWATRPTYTYICIYIYIHTHTHTYMHTSFTEGTLCKHYVDITLSDVWLSDRLLLRWWWTTILHISHSASTQLGMQTGSTTLRQHTTRLTNSVRRHTQV